MRMRGHAEHDDMKYVPKEMLALWTERDPIARYEGFLLNRGFASPEDLKGVEAGIEAQLAEDLAAAEASPFPDPGTALDGVYGDRSVRHPAPPLVGEWERRRT
jgi:TPP-dependent pyruvate/acetoin dehydrogenase alpha subunit